MTNFLLMDRPREGARPVAPEDEGAAKQFMDDIIRDDGPMPGEASTAPAEKPAAEQKGHFEPISNEEDPLQGLN